MLDVMDFLLNAVFFAMPLLFFRSYVNFFRKMVISLSTRRRIYKKNILKPVISGRKVD